jgi:hypothetical protein
MEQASTPFSADHRDRDRDRDRDHESTSPLCAVGHNCTESTESTERPIHPDPYPYPYPYPCAALRCAAFQGASRRCSPAEQTRADQSRARPGT